MIEVQLRPGAPGCLTVPLGCLTLGLVPLLMRMNQRHFAWRMDEQGIETRGGKLIGWSEFTSIKRVRSGRGMPGQGEALGCLLRRVHSGIAKRPSVGTDLAGKKRARGQRVHAGACAAAPSSSSAVARVPD
jgi:hypothetical protein